MRIFVAVLILGTNLLYTPVWADINNGLIAYYPLEGNVNDESGYGSHGVEVGNVSYVNGVLGKAARFDYNGYETPTAHVFVKSDIFSKVTTGLTISFWIKNGLEPQYSVSILRLMDYWSDPYPHVFNFSWNGKDINFYHSHHGSVCCASENQNLKISEDQQWHHIVAVFSHKNQLRVYKDGKQISAITSYDDDTGPVFGLNSLSFGLYFGRRLYSTSPRTQTQFELDEIRIYNRLLSSEEIQQLYRTKSSSSPPMGGNKSTAIQEQFMRSTMNFIQLVVPEYAGCGNISYGGCGTVKTDPNSGITMGQFPNGHTIMFTEWQVFYSYQIVTDGSFIGGQMFFFGSFSFLGNICGCIPTEFASSYRKGNRRETETHPTFVDESTKAILQKALERFDQLPDS